MFDTVEQLDIEEQISYIRNAFDHYVSEAFCITPDEAVDILSQAKGNSALVVSAFERVAALLQKEQYQEDEIVLQLIPEELKKLTQTAPAPASSSKTYDTRDRDNREYKAVTRHGRMSTEEQVERLLVEFKKRVSAKEELSYAEVTEFMSLAKGIGYVLQAFNDVGKYLRTRKFVVPTRSEIIDRIKQNIEREITKPKV